MKPSPSNPLVELKGLHKSFPIRSGVLKREQGRLQILNGIDLTIERGEILGLAGESGCGKSTLAKLLMQLHGEEAGSVRLEGERISALHKRDRLDYYARVQMVFQDPYASLNPRLKVSDILGEMLRIRGVKRSEERQRVAEMLEEVELDGDALDRYPHQFSGGQRQRIAIARALIVRPQLLIADEPVSALDLAVQERIVRLLLRLKSRYDLTILFISHDLNLMAELCDRVAVMYLGHIVEILPATGLLEQSRHPYVQALIRSIPSADPLARRLEEPPLLGEIPSPANLPAGCPFHTRCPRKLVQCDREPAPLRARGGVDRSVACHLYE